MVVVMMVRMLSMPIFVGMLCLVLLLGSLASYNLPEESSTLDIVPCESADRPLPLQC